ncbi:MAG: hypothetical protein N3F08_02545 [Crenarchaeota archaeon]|nr:hypothetical protein [Thermoproteota archaeon]
MGFNKLKADRLAEAVGEEFASKLKRNSVVGIVFLGGLTRVYFDRFLDVDIIFSRGRRRDWG